MYILYFVILFQMRHVKFKHFIMVIKESKKKLHQL